jgi:DNA transformation protein
MGVAQGDIDRAVELFSGLGDITTRKMMGGLCLYQDGTIFAILDSGGRVYLKGKGDFASDLEAAGCVQWTETMKSGKVSHMPYWTLPEDALDDPDTACDWARRALEHLCALRFR